MVLLEAAAAGIPIVAASVGGVPDMLMPDEARIKDLRADYRDMAPMMFDERPLTFDEILERIKEVQEAINK